MSKYDDPQSIGKYSVVRRIGQGGMGVVFEALTPSRKTVAIKLIHRDRTDDPQYRQRFAREIQLARRVNSPFTAQVLDADTEAERPWMVSAYIPARSLKDVVRGQLLTGERLLRLALGSAEALQDIHKSGLVHRDFKPANVLMTDDGPCVVDFGIAWAPDLTQLTRTGEIIGTPAYMAPEQVPAPGVVQAGEVTPAVDIFAWASVVVFAATGRDLFGAGFADSWAVLIEVQECDPDLSQVPQPLRDIVAQCLVADPTARPTADSLVAQLTALTGSAMPEWRPRPGVPWRRSVARGLVLAGVLAVVATSWVWWSSGDTEWTRSLAPSSAGMGQTSCTLAKEALFCAVPGRQVISVAPGSGKTLWRSTSGSAAEVSRLIGVSASVVLVVSSSQQEQTLVALDAGSGKQVWKKPQQADPVLAGQIVVASDGNGGTRGYSVQDGKEFWTHEGTNPNGIEIIGATSNAFYSRTVTESGMTLTAQDVRSGEVLWKQNISPNPGWAPIGVTAQGTLSFLGYDENMSKVMAVAQFRPDVGWKTAKLSEPVSSPMIAAFGNVFYFVVPSGSLFAVDCLTGEEMWRSDQEEELTSSPTVAAGHLYLLDSEGRLLAFDAASGVRQWSSSDHPSAQPVGNISLPGPTVTDGHAYALTGDNQLYSVDLPWLPRVEDTPARTTD